MNGEVHIRYIPQHSIDRNKWDACIDGAGNGLIYAYSWYLDRMAVHWDGLVMNDYEAVMPIPWNKKFFIPYIYQPFLAAQLGVFARNISDININQFIKAIPSKYLRIDLPFNEGNTQVLPGKHLVSRTNYVLPLDQPYEQLFVNYRDNTRRNIRKAQQQGCTIEKEPDVEKVIELAKSLMVSYGADPGENIARFRNIFSYLKEQGKAVTYGISLQGKLMASCVFFFSHNRAYYILVGNHPESKTSGVSHALVDAFIRDHAGSNLCLDFEGSDISTLAYFYSSFGAEKRKYPSYHRRKL